MPSAYLITNTLELNLRAGLPDLQPYLTGYSHGGSSHEKACPLMTQSPCNVLKQACWTLARRVATVLVASQLHNALDSLTWGLHTFDTTATRSQESFVRKLCGNLSRWQQVLPWWRASQNNSAEGALKVIW